MTTPIRRRIIRPVQEFLSTETAGGGVLLAATLLALALANLPVRDLYHDVLEYHLKIGLGDVAITETVEAWVNDALMTLFFFVVGLEIKRELVEGELRDPKTAALPVIAAGGGMVVPALIFAVLNLGDDTIRGWGIPVATDIAFAVGMLALLGRRVPGSLKIFLLTLAIADDIGGILVIALFYTETLSGPWLAGAVAGLLVIWGMQKAGVKSIAPYLVVGFGVWLATFESGIHATIAGVILGLMTPVAPVGGRRVLHKLEHRLHPWTSFAIIPIFALANAGLELSGEALGEAYRSRVTWGIILGLVVGKTIGVTAATLLAARFDLGRLPRAVTTRHVIGVGMLAGIGFTVALFIANLSFPSTLHPELLENARVGVLTGSVVAAILGSLWLIRAPSLPPEIAEDIGSLDVGGAQAEADR